MVQALRRALNTLWACQNDCLNCITYSTNHKHAQHKTCAYISSIGWWCETPSRFVGSVNFGKCPFYKTICFQLLSTKAWACIFTKHLPTEFPALLTNPYDIFPMIITLHWKCMSSIWKFIDVVSHCVKLSIFLATNTTDKHFLLLLWLLHVRLPLST